MCRTISQERKAKARARTRNKCAYCGFTDSVSTIDHIVPYSKCRNSKVSNLYGCCFTCNQSKKNMTVKQFRKALLNRSEWSLHWSDWVQYRLAARYWDFDGIFYYRSDDLKSVIRYEKFYHNAEMQLKRLVSKQIILSA